MAKPLAPPPLVPLQVQVGRGAQRLDNHRLPEKQRRMRSNYALPQSRFPLKHGDLALLFTTPPSSTPCLINPPSFHRCERDSNRTVPHFRSFKSMERKIHKRPSTHMTLDNESGSPVPEHPFTAGDEIEGKVTHITNFGAFMQLPGGLTGLVHISEIADKFIQSIEEHVKVGEVITVRVLSIDRERRKITLSKRKASASRATGYDRIVELGGDWGHPWNDDGNTTYMNLASTPPYTHPRHWEPDLSLFKPFNSASSESEQVDHEAQSQLADAAIENQPNTDSSTAQVESAEVDNLDLEEEQKKKQARRTGVAKEPESSST